MPLIHILRADGIEDDVEEALLVKTTGVDENDNEIVTWVEYRWPESDVIVHRSVAVQLKRWPAGLGAVIGDFS